VGDPKSEAGKRDVVIPAHILPDVQAYVSTISPGALVFPANRNDGHMASSALDWHWRQARETAGVPNLRFHDLRHFAGTMAAVAGATVAETMSRLGHSTPAAAQVYQHAAAGRDRVIAERLAAMAAE
jgi:integrase